MEDQNKQPIEFEKVDQVDSTKILAGAEVTMVGPGIDGETYTLVSTDGTFMAKKGSEEVTEFDYGEYTITETKAPAGYLPMTGTVTVTVNADGVTYQQTDNHSNEPIPADKANEDAPYVVIITNNPGKVLPHTGGPGTAINGILGTALIVGALMYGMVSRRTRERRSDA